MTEGIFSLIFSADGQQLVSGFAAFKDGRIRGGDDGFSYDGTYSLNEPSSDLSTNFQAEISAQYYKGINLAIFGKMAQFPIKISGVFTPEKISAHCKIMKFNHDEVDLIGVKIDDFQSKMTIEEQWNSLDIQSKLMNGECNQYLLSAQKSYSKGKYIDATNLCYAAIELIIRQSIIASIKGREKSHDNFLNMIDELMEKKIIDKIMYQSIHALASSEKILSKKSNSPEACAFPLCIMAMNSLAKILKI